MRVYLLGGLVFLFSCNSEKVARLEKENARLKERLDKSVTIETQAKCAAAAVSYKNANYSEDDKQTNHYSKTLGACFVMIETFSVGGTNEFEIFIHDALGGQVVGRFIEKTFPKPSEPSLCDVGDQGCKSQDEFRSLASYYMSN